MIFEHLQEILKLAKVGPNPQDGSSYQGHLRTSDGKNLYFSGQNITKFQTISEEIWKSNNELFETVTLKTVREQIFLLLEKELLDGDRFNEDEANQIIPNLLSLPMQEWEVFRPLYGANISADTTPLSLGIYTIYDVELHRSKILEKYPHSKEFYDMHLEYIDTNLIISVLVKARENQKANELSDMKFSQFDNILKYMLGNNDQYNVAVFNFTSWKVVHSLMFSNEELGSSSKNVGVFQKVDLSEEFFNDSNNGNAWIWTKLSSSKLNDLEKRIFAAINWIGKGSKEKEFANKFVQYIFALESLFTFQKKGVLVSPSIANQLSEFTAFILAENFESRKLILKIVKDLYAKRSAVAHGGSQSILEEEVNEAYAIVKGIITNLITQPDLLSLKSIEQLQEWIDNKKYS